MYHGIMLETMQGLQKQKILYVITKSNWGGAQRYVYDLATGLPEKIYDVVVACGGTGAKDAPQGVLADRLASAGIRTIYVPSFARDISILREFVALRELIDIFRKERPNIIHLNSSKAGVLGAIAGRIAGVPNIVFTSHGLAWDEPRGVLSRAFIYVSTWATFLLSHHIITISQDNYHRAQRLPLCSFKVNLIHNGITPLVHSLSRTDARAELMPSNQNTDAVWIGTIAELTENKNLGVALKSFASAYKKNPNLLYVIIGDGEKRILLEQLSKSFGISDVVHFAGYIPDAAQLLSAFDIFFLPSLKEGLPYVLLESGQHALSCIASRVGGIPDIITNGVSGVLCNSKSIEEFATALATLSTDKEKRMFFGQNLKEVVEQKYGMSTMLKETSILYSLSSYIKNTNSF